MSETICCVAECERATRSKTHGYCNVHYQRWYRHGDPLAGKPIYGSVLERFTAKYVVDPVTGCWNWQAALDEDGYGRFTAPGRKSTTAHRWAYIHYVGPVPDDLVLDHIVCENRGCCNPEHVTPTTPTQNTMRSPLFGSNRTHCKRGHEYTPENTRHRITASGYHGRMCIECNRLMSRAYNARRRASAKSATRSDSHDR